MFYITAYFPPISSTRKNKIIAKNNVKELFPCVFFWEFLVLHLIVIVIYMVYGFTSKSVVHFLLILLSDTIKGFCKLIFKFPSNICWIDCFFCIKYSLLFCQMLVDCIFTSLFLDSQFFSVQLSCSVVSDSLRPRESQHARPPCPSPTPRVHSHSHPSSWWCHPTISSSVVPFSSCPQSLPASESFPMSQLFTWGGQSIRVSALASFLPKNTQGWSPLEWTGWISLQSKGLSRVFSSITVQNH